MIGMQRIDQVVRLHWLNHTWHFKKENVGQVWAERSGGECLFVMARNNDYAPIRAVVEG